MPTRISPMMPKPVPRTILPASQPAIRPTNRMTKMPSLEICILKPPSLYFPAGNLAAIGRHDDPHQQFPWETFALQRRYGDMTKPDTWYVAFGPDKDGETDGGGPRSTRTFKS